MFLACFFVVLKMIPWFKIFKLAAVLITLILAVYCLLSEETAKNLPEWVKSIVGIAAFTAFAAVYITIALIGTVWRILI